MLALLLYLLVAKTRLGALVRAGASNREMSEAMGVDVRRCSRWCSASAPRLCAVAGALLGPLLAVQVGMGENILILAFVVIVIGGIGSIRGALVGALLVGCIDTLGRSLLQHAFREFLPPQWASAAGPAFASIAVYVFMAVVLALKPQGLFPARADDAARRDRRCAQSARHRAVLARLALPWRCDALGVDLLPQLRQPHLVYAIAATSLNLVLGYGGMVSFGHAAFVGLGAYVTGILIGEGVVNGWRAPGRHAAGAPRWRRCSSARSRCARAACTSS